MEPLLRSFYAKEVSWWVSVKPLNWSAQAMCSILSLNNIQILLTSSLEAQIRIADCSQHMRTPIKRPSARNVEMLGVSTKLSCIISSHLMPPEMIQIQAITSGSKQWPALSKKHIQSLCGIASQGASGALAGRPP